jgi:prepilin-type processing-associated H-X9-DG protein
VDFWPVETDEPNNNLYYAGGWGNPPELTRAIIPRHGWKDPAQAPQNYNIATPLPGGIDIGMFDGHVEAARLEQMLTYSWHKNWVVPNPKPGLP